MGRPSGFYDQPSHATGFCELGRGCCFTGLPGQFLPNEAGRRANFGPWREFKWKSLFISSLGSKWIQNSKIHIYFNTCPKFMKPIPLFF
jgi:hypothetical protein